MDRRFCFLPAIVVVAFANCAFAQSIQYSVPEKPWPADLGSHRVVVHVAATEAGVAHVHLDWRRRDAAPEQKGVIVVNAATGENVAHAAAARVTAESGEVNFRTTGPGEYFVYFLPGHPGGGAFPQAKYLPPAEASPALSTPTCEAQPVRWEARTEHGRFNEMEIIATAAECEVWLARHGNPAFTVFPETRERSVRMFDHVPEIWLKRTELPKFAAQLNEFYPFQLGVWAARKDLRNLRVTFSDLVSPEGARLDSSSLHCLQSSGTGWDGNALFVAMNVAAGQVQPLWCAFDVPEKARAGRYRGTAEIAADGLPSQRIDLAFDIAGPALADRGDSEPTRLTRLRWLDSRIAQDDEPVKPYAAVKVEGRQVSLLGRKMTLGNDGLPQQVATFFDGGVTHLVDRPTELLTAPMQFVVELADGRTLPLNASGFHFTKTDAGVSEWESKLSGDGVTMDVSGRLEFDGQVEVRTTLTASRPVAVKDVRLEIPRTAATTSLILGLGNYGGATPARIDWKWDVAHKNQDALWLGTVNAGLRVQLRAENYVRPYVNIHYLRQPLNAPPSWDNTGRGGIRFERSENAAPLTCYSGARTLEPGRPLHFDFDLSITPFHTLNTAAQWKERYYHVSGVTDPEKVRETGANVVNIHQGNALNPYINYPFLTANKLAGYAARIHTAGMRVKYYYTVRELTNWTPELFAARSFGGELIARGNGAGHAWCEEHLGGQYWQAWAEPRVDDSSILTASMSRWNNLYLEGLDWLTKNAGCDGLYLDDISYDRTVMKRARKILDRSPAVQAHGGGLIDLHSWNEIRDARAGHASCALLFMDSLPYVDRMWFGEGHPYEGPAEQTLTAVSGIPFGLMGEMLEGGGNPWLGLTFGMTGRLGWGGQPREIWKLWDGFGVSDAEFIGWWNPACPVKAEQPEVKVTAWKRAGKVLLAVGNFGAQPVQARLVIDWQALGLDPAKTWLHAPAMDKFQPAHEWRSGEALPLAPKRGLALILDETAPAALPTSADATTLALQKRRVLFEDRFVPKQKDGWTVTAGSPQMIKYDGEGQVFLAPANVHAWTAHNVPEGTRVVAAQIRQDGGDQAQQWGPGLAVTWADGKSLKVNRRSDGRFGVAINGREQLEGQCDRELPVTLAIYLDNTRVRIVAMGEGAFQQEQELASRPRSEFPGIPTELRLGKMPASLKPVDFGTPGEMGWSRVDWVRVLGE